MNIDLTQITSITEYLDKLDGVKDKYLILIAVKDNAGYWLDKEIQNKLCKLGLRQSLIHEEMVGYVAAISNGIVICEQKSPKDGIEEYQGLINGKKIYLLSKPYLSGNTSSIQIDGKEYSNNSRGLNIVVYDNESNRVVDRVSFDTHVQEYDCVHLKTHYDIGIFGWWYNANYGATLTYYALNRAVSDMGYSVVMLFRGSPSATMPKSVSIDLAKRHYDISPRSEIKDLCRFNDLCDTFLLGSDQLWNPDLEKVAGKQFFLDFADDDKRLIAYAQSFGNYTRLPEEFSNRYKDLVNRFDAVSVREDYASKTCEESFGVKAPQVCDPVFLVDRECFEKLADEADIELPNEYLMCFILDPTREKIQLCERVKEKIGVDEAIYFTDLDGANDKAKQFEGVRVFPSSSIENFVKAYQGAKYIVTDSFHGTCLSVIFEKPFLSLANHGRGKGRFESLMRWLHLENRLLFDINIDDSIVFTDIDYISVRKIIKNGRDYGMNWLKNALDNQLPKLKDINSLLDTSMCTGCGACINACNVDAINYDKNQWGYFKSVVNYSKCIQCGKCADACPALKLPLNTNRQTPKCYAVQAQDEEVLNSSSSGGIFYHIAKYSLSHGGCVYGAAWNYGFKVHHICISSMDELYELQKSKYVQSYIGNIYKDVERKVKDGCEVVFSGTPCQIAGLKKYLGREYGNLILVDLLCGNAPSQMFFQKYLMDDCPDNVASYEFRSKKKGWRADCLTLTLTDGNKIVRRGASEDGYQRAYHNHLMCPQHCELCKYQRLPRIGDITIGDFWGISNHDKSYGLKEGVSVCLSNNDKADCILADILSSDYISCKEVPLSWVGGNGFLCGNNWIHKNRDEFYDAILKMPFNKAVDYALRPLKEGQINTVAQSYGYDYRTSRFEFNPEFWVESNNNGIITLSTKNEVNPPGKYASLYLGENLKEGDKYNLTIEFACSTDSPIINFHIKDSGSNALQVIYRYNVEKDKNGQFMTISTAFVPNKSYFDQFMVGAAHFNGKESYIQFRRILITNDKAENNTNLPLVKKDIERDDKIESQNVTMKKEISELKKE